MGIRTALTIVWPGSRDEIHVECRHCGTTLEPPSEQCPECGATEFSQYEL